MSEYNFQQGLGDLAQAGQLSAANEAARNSIKLLEARKQQSAIEQQKLQLNAPASRPKKSCRGHKKQIR
jgi:hypothetical protein